MYITYWESKGNFYFNWDEIIFDLQSPYVDYNTCEYQLVPQPSDQPAPLFELHPFNLKLLTNSIAAKPEQIVIHTAFKKLLNGFHKPTHEVFSAEELKSLHEMGINLDTDSQPSAQATETTISQQSEASSSSSKPRSRRAARNVDYDEYASSADQASPSEASVRSSHKRDPRISDEQLADLLVTLKGDKEFSKEQKRVFCTTSIPVFNKVNHVDGLTKELHKDLANMRRKLRNGVSAHRSRVNHTEHKAFTEQRLKDALHEIQELKSDVERLTTERTRLISERDAFSEELARQKAGIVPSQGGDQRFFSASLPSQSSSVSYPVNDALLPGNKRKSPVP